MTTQALADGWKTEIAGKDWMDAGGYVMLVVSLAGGTGQAPLAHTAHGDADREGNGSMDRSTINEFSIERKPVARYFYWGHILIILIVGIWFVGLGVPLAILHGITLGPWLSKKQAEALHYWLDGGSLRVDQGVFFLKRKTIPLDRVTDVVLAQGPLLKLCKIWELRVQTAGTGQTTPEATLYGITDPDAVRDVIMMTRDEIITGGD